MKAVEVLFWSQDLSVCVLVLDGYSPVTALVVLGLQVGAIWPALSESVCLYFECTFPGERLKSYMNFL